MKRYSVLACAAVVATITSSCGALGGSGGGRAGGGGSAGFSAQCRDDFGATATANEFEAFMNATWRFHEASLEAQNSLLSTCQQMGNELGMPGNELSGEGPEGTRTVCEAVSARLREEIAAMRQGSGTEIELRTTPPRCQARFSAYADCAARCDASIQPGSLEVRCEGGEVRGGCSGQCTGRCAVEVNAACDGTCEGACDGRCAATGSDGMCAGRCDGNCRGQCVADARAQCTGECRGECSVEWQEPYCTTNYAPPQVSAECRAACEAEVEASMECQPGQAELIVSGGPTGAELERQQRVQAAVRIGLANVLAIRTRLQRLQQSGGEMLTRLTRLPNAVRELGVSAAACSAGAVSDMQQSIAAVSVTASVSVTVSASVSVEG